MSDSWKAKEAWRQTLMDLGLSVRAVNCLAEEYGCDGSIDLVLAASDRELLRISNMGPTTLKEIRAKIGPPQT